MIQDVIISFRDIRSTQTFDIPNYCPHCGEVMSPYVVYGYSENNSGDLNRIVGIFLQCTISNCNKFFALEYEHYNYKYNLSNYSYRPLIQVTLPENIERVSEKFVEIYTQATKAESEKLDQIAGVGYRKATEFLIKDYAIRKNPNDKKSIEKMFLGKVIDTYLKDFPKLQSLSKASAWIGNDETHYVRRHEDKDINDMKAFILSAAQFIAADYDTDIALEFISDCSNN